MTVVTGGSTISPQVERDYSITWPVALAVAESIVRSKAALQKGAPQAVDLAEMITGVGEALTMQGAPQLQISLLDDEFALMESGFWGADPKTGKLDEIELNYPAGSKYWWRVRQVSPKADFTVETYWIPKGVRELMDHKGPLRISRGQRTRAEAIQMLCSKVPGIRLHSRQLTEKQPVTKPKIPSGSTNATNLGLNAKSAKEKGLLVKGSPISSTQRDTLATLLQVADQAKAGAVATVALIFAAIWESSLGENTSSNGAYWGVLSGSVSLWRQNDTVGMAEAFLHGGKGFQQGGAIRLSTSQSNPAAVASQVEGAIPLDEHGVSRQYESESGWPGIEKAVEEARALVEGGGGAVGGAGGSAGSSVSVEHVKEFFFEVGTTNEPNEDYWTAMNRWAQQVNWELVVDGPDFYYDDDPTLARAEVIDVINRTDDNVGDWDYDWDDRQIATNFQIVLECDEFTMIPGKPVEVHKFGVATEGSTIGRPGVWLIGECQRNPGDIVATLTLVQPTAALKEPASEIEKREIGKGVTDEAGAHALPLARGYMTPLGRTDDGVDIENAPDGATVYAMTNGICTAVASDPAGFGPNYPVIEITEGSRKGKCYYYGHVAKSLVKVGQRVSAGEPVAIMGHEGDARELGHGHIEIGWCDKNGTPLNQHGAVAETQAGKEMREFLVYLCALFGVKAS